MGGAGCETGAMTDWMIGLIVAGSLVLLAVLVHAIVNYRRLRRQIAIMGREITSLTLATWRQARRIVILLIGSSVMLVGVVLVFLPGPAVIVIPLGLAILAAEFTWARRWMRQLRYTLHLSKRKAKTFGWKRRTKASLDG